MSSFQADHYFYVWTSEVKMQTKKKIGDNLSYRKEFSRYENDQAKYIYFVFKDSNMELLTNLRALMCSKIVIPHVLKMCSFCGQSCPFTPKVPHLRSLYNDHFKIFSEPKDTS